MGGSKCIRTIGKVYFGTSSLILYREVYYSVSLFGRVHYNQTWLESHCLQHQPLYNNTHARNGFNGLCTNCPGYNNNLVITAYSSGTKGVVNKFDCIRGFTVCDWESPLSEITLSTVVMIGVCGILVDHCFVA